MTIEIEALDTLFFRDGKPFSMGDDAWANGMFPPLPSVLYGALRSAYMAQNNIPIDEIIEKTKGFKIKQIALILNGQKYFSMPLDLVGNSDILDEEEKKLQKGGKDVILPVFNLTDIQKTASLENKNILNSHLNNENLEGILTMPKDYTDQVESIEEGIIEINSSFKSYLQKNKTDFNDIRKLGNNIKSEPKIGISRKNSTRTTEEGNLYRINMQRLDKVTLYIDFEGITLSEKGLLRLGAESKIARYKKIGKTEIPKIEEEGIKEFKIYLSTPAIFKKGFYPTKIFKEANVEVKLITCAVGKYINVGGFDMQERKPKQMQKAVPAGSVYYYRLEKGNLKDLQKKLNEIGICEYRSDEGFGIAYLGKI